MTDYVYTFEDITDANDGWTYASSHGSAGAVVTTDNGNWFFDTNETGSSDVGPYHGETTEGTTAGYIYTENSAPGIDGSTYTMQWDTTLNASLNNYTFEFYWCARGTNAEPLIEVQTNENGAGWVTRLTTGSSGNGGDETIPDTGATDGNTPWFNKSVDLTSLISHSSTLLRILITCDTNVADSSQFWHNDIGIDSITIVETSAASKDQEAFRFEDDDNTEVLATQLGAGQNSDISRSTEDPFRVRVGTQMVGDPPTESATLQYKENGDAVGEWRDVE